MQSLTRGGSWSRVAPASTSSRTAAPLRPIITTAAAAAGRRRTFRRAAASEASGGGGDGGAGESATPRPPLKLDAKGEAEWRRIDKKVNKYPAVREFKAIGVDELGPDGSTFAAAMTRCVSSVVGPLHLECISTSSSKNGTYVAVRIGPVYVQTPEQVIEIFKNFQSDPRCKFCM